MPTTWQYAPRDIAPAGRAVLPVGTLKLYTITVDGHVPPPDAVPSAVERARALLATPSAPCTAAGVAWHTVPSEGAGALIVHRGRDALFAVLAWWVGVNMLRQHTWVAPLDAPPEFESLAATGLTTCVWELAVLQHERAAWLRHVFTATSARDLDAYLDDVFTGTA
jgi:hypothetical protein